MPFYANPHPEPGRKRSIGEQIDVRLDLDEQTMVALDAQHRELAARVDGLAAAVAVLEELLLGVRRAS